MNAYELAKLMLDVTDCESSEYYQAGLMLRQQADQLDKVIPQLVKANGLIENLRIRIAELEVCENTLKAWTWNNEKEKYTPPVKQLSDEEIYEVWKRAMAEEAEISKTKKYDTFLAKQPFIYFARAIIKEITE